MGDLPDRGNHNVTAIYQRYMGWFDGNPARLWPHPPQPLSERYVAAIGGIDRVVEVAQAAYSEGDFRRAATLLDHAVFADADHGAARALYADTLEQLAYGSENGNFRVTLRNGVLVYVEKPADTATAQASVALTKPRMLALVGGDTDSEGIDVAGDTTVLTRLLTVLDKGDDNFNIVTP